MNKKVIILAGVVWGLVFISGLSYYSLKKSSEKINIIEMNKKDIETKDEEQEKATFYVVSEGKSLIKKEENIPVYHKIKDKIRKVTEISLKNLYDNKILSKDDIEIKNIYIKDDIVYLDINKEILELKSENRRNLLAVYSIVNSITELGKVRKVKFLVDGKEETGIFFNTYTRNTNI